MAIELTWLVPNKILLSRWSGDVRGDDMRVLVDELSIILDAADQHIHTLIDLTDVRSIAPDVMPIYLQSRNPNHIRRGRIALAGEVEGVRALADRLNAAAQRELVRLFATRAEARDFLMRFDSPPPVLPPDTESDPLAENGTAPEGESPGADE